MYRKIINPAVGHIIFAGLLAAALVALGILSFTGCGLQDGTAATVVPPATTDSGVAADAEPSFRGDTDTDVTDPPPPKPDSGTTVVVDSGSVPADSGVDTGMDSGVAAAMPGPVMSPGAKQLRFSDRYIAGSPCGDVLGTLPGTSWTSGLTIRDTNADHWLELDYTALAAGTYTFSYRDRACPGETPDRTNWALYGDPTTMKMMSAASRAFINCNWWNAATETVITGVTDPVCNLKVTVATSGAITGAGNMANLK